MLFRNKFTRVSILLVTLYIAVVGGFYIKQRALMYKPLNDIAAISEYALGEMQDLTITAEDGVLIQAWYHKPAESMPLVVYLHGNYGHLGYRANTFRALLKQGYGVIAPSWRSFSKSQGEPSELGLYHDARAAIKFAQDNGYRTEDMLLVGESLGTGVASKMATENQFRGIFLITPYTSIAERATEMYPFLPIKLLLLDNFSNLENIEKVNAPLLIVHGDQDTVIPHSHSERIIAKAKEPKKLIIYPRKGHSDLDVNAIFDEMSQYFDVKAAQRYYQPATSLENLQPSNVEASSKSEKVESARDSDEVAAAEAEKEAWATNSLEGQEEVREAMEQSLNKVEKGMEEVGKAMGEVEEGMQEAGKGMEEEVEQETLEVEKAMEEAEGGRAMRAIEEAMMRPAETQAVQA
jgi:dienelactone hydrolase